jgi:hypothetical protein
MCSKISINFSGNCAGSPPPAPPTANSSLEYGAGGFGLGDFRVSSSLDSVAPPPPNGPPSSKYQLPAYLQSPPRGGKQPSNPEEVIPASPPRSAPRSSPGYGDDSFNASRETLNDQGDDGEDSRGGEDGQDDLEGSPMHGGAPWPTQGLGGFGSEDDDEGHSFVQGGERRSSPQRLGDTGDRLEQARTCYISVVNRNSFGLIFFGLRSRVCSDDPRHRRKHEAMARSRRECP